MNRQHVDAAASSALQVFDNLSLSNESCPAFSLDAANGEPPASQFVVKVVGDLSSAANTRYLAACPVRMSARAADSVQRLEQQTYCTAKSSVRTGRHEQVLTDNRGA